MKKYTDDQAILFWRRFNFDKIPKRQIAKENGVCKDSVNKWIKKVKTNPELLKKASNGQNFSSNESKSKKVREWLNKNPTGVHKEFMKDTGIEISNSHFSTLKTKSNTKTKPVNEIAVIHQLQRELSFYKWWNEGERQGFIEQLLKELAK